MNYWLILNNKANQLIDEVFGFTINHMYRPYWDEPAKEKKVKPTPPPNNDNVKSKFGQWWKESEEWSERAKVGELKGAVPVLTKWDMKIIDQSQLKGAPYKFNSNDYQVIKYLFAEGLSINGAVERFKKDQVSGYKKTKVAAYYRGMNIAMDMERQESVQKTV